MTRSLENFDFRAVVTIPYYDDEGNDKVAHLLIKNVNLYGGYAFGCSVEELHFAIDRLGDLPQVEYNKLVDIAEEHLDTSIEGWCWGVADVIWQATGFKDKRDRLIYDHDRVRAFIFGNIGTLGTDEGSRETDSEATGVISWQNGMWVIVLDDDCEVKQKTNNDFVLLSEITDKENIDIVESADGFHGFVEFEKDGETNG